MSVPQRFSATIGYNPAATSHVAMVCFHRTSRGMRSRLTRLGYKHSPRADAVCWQARRFDGKVVAEIHLSMEDCSLHNIVHESVHAAWHRLFILGTKDDDWNQETMAEDTARLTCKIMNLVAKARRVLARKRRKR